MKVDGNLNKDNKNNKLSVGDVLGETKKMDCSYHDDREESRQKFIKRLKSKRSMNAALSKCELNELIQIKNNFEFLIDSLIEKKEHENAIEKEKIDKAIEVIKDLESRGIDKDLLKRLINM